MCFEWDKRYFHELEEKKSKEKVDALIREAEHAVKANRVQESLKGFLSQFSRRKEKEPS